MILVLLLAQGQSLSNNIELQAFQINSSHRRIYTGLPTKDETTETTVRNLYRQFPYFHDSLLNCKLDSVYAKSYNTHL